MVFSDFVKKVRQDLGLSQAEFAKALNVSFTTINRWENNRVAPSNLALKNFVDFCQDNFIVVPLELRKEESLSPLSVISE
jgi:transcriptional regulator with XRE-family HTH domain